MQKKNPANQITQHALAARFQVHIRTINNKCKKYPDLAKLKRKVYGRIYYPEKEATQLLSEILPLNRTN